MRCTKVDYAKKAGEFVNGWGIAREVMGNYGYVHKVKHVRL